MAKNPTPREKATLPGKAAAPVRKPSPAKPVPAAKPVAAAKPAAPATVPSGDWGAAPATAPVAARAKAAPVATKPVAAPAPAPTPAPVASPVVPSVPAVAEKPAVAPVDAPSPAASPATRVAAVGNTPAPVPATAPGAGIMEGLSKMNDTIEQMKTTAEANQAKAQDMLKDMGEKAKVAAEKSVQLMSDANDFGKGNIEAVVESQKIAIKGAQEMGRENLEYAKSSFDQSAAVMKDLAAVKSPTEYLEIQGEFVRKSFDQMVQQLSKNTETMLKLYGDAFQPLSSRMSVAVEKLKVTA